MLSHWRCSFAIVIALLVMVPARAEDLFSVEFPMGEFNVINGEPCLLRPGDRGPPGNALDIKGTSLVHFSSQEPLAYPLGGTKMPVVTLGTADGAGTAWDLSELVRGRRGPIRAAEGKFKGWYLDWSELE